MSTVWCGCRVQCEHGVVWCVVGTSVVVGAVGAVWCGLGCGCGWCMVWLWVQRGSQVRAPSQASRPRARAVLSRSSRGR